MNFETVVPKLQAVAAELKRTHGSLQLLGIFLPHRPLFLRWDLVVAAPWLRSDARESLKAVIDVLSAYLTVEERVQMSRVVVLTRAEDALQEFIDRFDGTPGLYHFRFETAGGATIRKAYIVEANGFGPRKDPVPLPRRKKRKADPVPAAAP